LYENAQRRDKNTDNGKEQRRMKLIGHRLQLLPKRQWNKIGGVVRVKWAINYDNKKGSEEDKFNCGSQTVSLSEKNSENRYYHSIDDPRGYGHRKKNINRPSCEARAGPFVYTSNHSNSNSDVNRVDQIIAPRNEIL